MADLSFFAKHPASDSLTVSEEVHHDQSNRLKMCLSQCKSPFLLASSREKRPDRKRKLQFLEGGSPLAQVLVDERTACMKSSYVDAKDQASQGVALKTRQRQDISSPLKGLLRLLALVLSLGRIAQGQTTEAPSPTPAPVAVPSSVPTPTSTVGSLAPTEAPQTVAPTPVPTPVPTALPTRSAAPTSSFAPSLSPTVTRTPTESPSDVPSSTPSSPESNTVRQLFQQEFLVPLVNGSAFFTINETVVIGDLYASYTPRFAPESVGLVFSECIANFQTQRVFNVPNSTNTSTNILEYTCGYLSRFVNVSTYPQLFLEYVNGNLDTVTSDLQNLEVNVIRAENTQAVQVLETPAPTPLGPTIPPSTLSPYPSPMPSGVPTALGPTASPTEDKIPEITPQPTPGDNRGDGFPVPAIAAIVVVAGIAILLGLAFFFRQRLKKRQASSPRNRRHGGNDVFVRRKDVQSDVGIGMPPSGSIMSDKSLVSEGGSGLGGASDDEMDGTKNLQDEFDQYKDQNLEQLRSDVEGNLAGFEGIMSAAVTKALMGDEDSKIDHRELMWGCHGNPTGAEVEASALCDVNDWLKRNELAPVERKRAFMQDMLNKMVASVRFGVLHAEDASRTIHESAALLGLQLANELPMTTVIISGMRKTVKAAQFVKVLEEFGEIDVAAVASGERGFGIVRFRHPKSVERAMRRYRNAEIVVEDVAVQLKVITPSGEVLSRA